MTAVVAAVVALLTGLMLVFASLTGRRRPDAAERHEQTEEPLPEQLRRPPRPRYPL